MDRHTLTYWRTYRKLLVAVYLPIIVCGCSFQSFEAKPIDNAAITKKFELKSPNSPNFHQYLLENGYSNQQLPLERFGLDELSYCALFYHPSLDTSRALWRSAQLAELAAMTRPLPTISGQLAKSNQANGDISPYALGFSIDIPIETNSKREIRIEAAKFLSSAAKLEIAQTAWELRNQLGISLQEFLFNQKSLAILSSEQALRENIVALYQKRLSLGAASNVELSIAKLQLQTTIAEWNNLTKTQRVTEAKLASNLGLPIHEVALMRLEDTSSTNQELSTLDISKLTQEALLNRLDIRIALERYAAIESKLKLEIANQYPNLNISPGYAYEFGDNIWSLGISSLLRLLDKNKVAIREAAQLREVEAAQFETLQTKVITDVGIAQATVVQAKQSLANQLKVLSQQQQNTARMQRKFNAGEIDRLEFSFSKLEEIFAEKNSALAEYQLKIALHQLENVIQKPLSKLKPVS